MAYQPKSYRKFVATAATATLVASAVTPAFAAETGAAASFSDVPDRYKEAVDYLVDNKITLGVTDTQFGTTQAIKRVDAAVMIAKALEIEVADRPDSGFTDVPDRAKAYVDALKAEGIINGKTATTFGSSQDITRGEIALILANAYDLNGTSDKEFSDVSSRYEAAVEALVAAGITQGKTATTFGTSDAITRGEFAIFLYKAENIDEGTPEVSAVSATTANTVTTVTATVKGAVEGDKATVEIFANGSGSAAATKTADVVNGKVSTDFSNLPAGTHVAKVTFKDSSAQTSFTVATTELAVSSVEATDLKTVKVKFTAPVDEVTATNKNNYDFGGLTGSAGISSIELSSDKTVATITLASTLANKAYVTATVSKSDSILDVDGEKLDQYQAPVYINDTTRPVVTEQQYNNANQTFTVKFSEAVSLPSGSSVVVTDANGVQVSPTSTTLAADGKSLSVVTTNLATDKTYTVTMVGAVDLANNFFAGNSVVSSFTKGATETVKPTVQTVEAVSSTQIKVTFSEKLGAPGTLNGNTLTKVNSLKDTPANYNYEVDSTGLVYTIQVPAMTDNTVTAYQFAGQADLANNVIDTVVKNVPYTKDSKDPEVVSTVANGKVVTISYNEDVTVTGANAKVLTPSGVLLTVPSSAISTVSNFPERVRVDLTSVVESVENGTYKITLADGIVKDAEGNSKEYSVNASLGNQDTTKPEVASASIAVTPSANGGTVRVPYSENMGASAIDVNNYTVDGVKVFNNAYFDGSRDAVILELKENAFASTANRNLEINNVADVAGNTLKESFTKTLSFTDNTAPSLVKAELQTDLRTIKLTFNEAMNVSSIAEGTAVADFKVLIGDAQESGVVEALDATDLTNKTFTLTLSDSLNATEFAKSITIAPTDDFEVTDTSNNKHAKFANVPVTK